MTRILIVAWLLLVASSIAYALPRHGVAVVSGGGGGPPPTVDNSCGVTTNNWCIQPNGWTMVTAKTGSTGTACSNDSSATWNGTCIVAVDRNPVANINGSISVNTLTVNSFSSGALAVGQTISVGTAAGRTLTAGSGTSWTVSGASLGTVPSETMVTIPGNDSTCHMQPATTGYTTEQLATFVPPLPCANLNVAQTKVRLVSADWIVIKLGGADYGALNSTNGSLVNKSGTSAASPLVFTSYGTGAKALMTRQNGTITTLIELHGLAGNNTAWLLSAIKLYDPLTDPSSPLYSGATIVGNTGTANGCVTNTEICNIVGGVPAVIAASPSSFSVFGTGIENAAITSVGANNIVFTATTVPAAAMGTGVTYQINDTTNIQAGFSAPISFDFLLVEGGEFYFSGLSIGSNAVPGLGTNILLRRNMISYAATFTSGACLFTDVTRINGVNFLFEENVCNWGGLYPWRWAQGKRTGTHGFYLHNPSTGQNLTRNIIANNSSTGVQHRDALNLYNNLFINNTTNVSSNVTLYNYTASYNVFANGVPGNYGYRTAICGTTCTSGTTLGMSGIVVSPSSDCNPCTIRNLTNPGSVTGTISSSSGYTGPTTATLVGTGLAPGVRGDGVKTGDLLQFMTTVGLGLQITRNQQFWSRGPIGGANGTYLGPNTVTVTAASPAVVTESGGSGNIRLADEPFQFTAGTLPGGISLNTDYCSASQGNSYQIYMPTAGACAGGASINTTGATQSGVTRTGTRKFLFIAQSPPDATYTGVLPWVTPGMDVTANGGAGACGTSAPAWPGNLTQVTSISANSGVTRGQAIFADPTLLSVSGKDDANTSVSFGGVGNPNAPTITVGPNNIFTNVVNRTGASAALGTFFAISAQCATWGINASGNYAHNWSPNTMFNVYDISGGNQTALTGGAAYAASNSYSWVLNDVSTTTKLEALVEAYDATARGTTFTGTIAPNGSGGSIVTINSGTPPLAGDTLFDASGSNPLGWYVQIPPAQTIGSTFFIDQPFTKATPFAMKSGSVDHFMSMALAQSKASWDPTWTANSANNFIRNAIGCTAASTPPCPAQ